ncbi:putative nuclease HARBI1 [Eriocheir sinensis]|uniref:putative nuclease HARBI1 n=1 Tax=Eriocheir sinensis TaxID=95602 RepID=UPI0021C6D899|nr:putative nuclease HARBI1 [Eriocheir sinensis]
MYASGSFQQVIGNITGPFQPSVSRVFMDVANALSNKAMREIKMPSSEQGRRAVARNFSRIRNLPRVVGAIECTHVAPKGPRIDEALCMNSYLRERFAEGEFGEYLLLGVYGDSGYPLESLLITPVANPMTAAEERYSRAHIRTRFVVEQTFGVLKSRFR